MKLTARIKAQAAAPKPAFSPPALKHPWPAEVLRYLQPDYITSIETSADYKSSAMRVRVEYRVPDTALLEAP